MLPAAQSKAQAVAAPPKEAIKYCESVSTTKRRPTRTIHVRRCRVAAADYVHADENHDNFLQIGKVKVGSEHRIALQTMTTTDTRDVEATVAQVIGVNPFMGNRLFCTIGALVT